ncbi:MAG: methionine--tRNA ligase subunit beta [Candidatus Diapherotrites archaeon]|nr:methionine--tRNA ligase subunit beta [Candidatus Diapherotrites archaeon]
MERISFDEWKKIELLTAKIESVEDIPGKDKLYKLTIDAGAEKRTIVAGIKGHYSKEELEGKTVILLANLKPRKIAGIESNGMLMAVLDSNNLTVLTTDRKIQTGIRVE